MSTNTSKNYNNLVQEINQIFQERYDYSSGPDSIVPEELRMVERFIINDLWHKVSEVLKKYQE